MGVKTVLCKSLNQSSASQIFVFDFYIGQTFMKYYGDTALASVSCQGHKISLSNWAAWTNGQKKKSLWDYIWKLKPTEINKAP